MLHFPYQTFNHLIDFLREAAIDPQVKEIGITIYRVAAASRVVNALLNAIRNGKTVTVVIELQARFDEEANIMWSNKLQEEGAFVINGIPGMKVHSKLVWVKRREENSDRNYAYIGTGNFHEGTARVYADDGILTADPRLADEVEMIFDFFKQNYRHNSYSHLVVSPFYMRNVFAKHIDREIELAKEGKNAWMILKMNSLIDPGMMAKLYKAARAGVKIDLIVRGIFGLRLDRKKFKENVKAISIVDKYLEHSRIFLFGNDGEERMYIASADWMPRNLNRRIEVACPVYDEEIRNEIKQMLRIQLADNSKARILDPLLQNHYNRQNQDAAFRAQEDFYNYIKKKHQIVLKIYYNPRCARCREALKYLEAKNYELEIRKYITEGLTEKEVIELLEKTGKHPLELVRTQDKIFREKYKGKTLSPEQWAKALADHPAMMQRPLVVNGNQAVLAIPPENVESIM
jgi:polyphosphate kinase